VHRTGRCSSSSKTYNLAKYKKIERDYMIHIITHITKEMSFFFCFFCFKATFTLKFLKATKIYFLYEKILLILTLFGFFNRAFTHYTNLNNDPISNYRGFIFNLLVLLYKWKLHMFKMKSNVRIVV